LADLHRKGIALPDPAEILGNLDKEGEDPDDAPCLRETDEHADFIVSLCINRGCVYCFQQSSNIMCLEAGGYIKLHILWHTNQDYFYAYGWLNLGKLIRRQ
jgi:hypothetical protein